MDKYEDPRLAALHQGVVVTSENAVVGAEAVSMAYGVVIIRNINMEGKPHVACQLESNYRMRCWYPDGKFYSWTERPDLYYPAGKIPGKVPVKEPESETVKVRLRPYVGRISGYQLFAYEDQILDYMNCSTTINWNGPEQEVEIQVYKEENK